MASKKDNNVKDESKGFKDHGSQGANSIDSAYRGKGKKSCNSPAYYDRNPELTSTAGAIQWDYATGEQLELTYDDNDVNTTRFVIPGIYNQHVVCIPGIADQSKESPLNMAMVGITAALRSKNSGAWPYNTTDVIKVMIAVDNIYTAIQYAKYLYGLTTAQASVNKYFGEGVFHAHNFNYVASRRELANFRNELNTQIIKINAYRVPLLFDVFRRHVDLWSQIFIDGNDAKCQMYQYVPDAFYIWTEGAETTDWKLRCTPISEWYDETTSQLTFDGLIKMISHMIGQVVASESFGNMIADMSKVFGGEAITTDQITVDYTTPLIPLDAMMDQIKMSTPGPKFSQLTHMDITEDVMSGTLRCQPRALLGHEIAGRGDRLLCTKASDPDPLHNIYITRSINLWNSDGTADYLEAASTEVNTGATITVCNGYKSGVIQFEEVDYEAPIFKESDPTSTVLIKLKKLSKLIQYASDFVFAPNLRWFEVGSDGKYSELGHMFPVDNFTIVQRRDLIRMNRAATLSLWNVPRVGYSNYSK